MPRKVLPPPSCDVYTPSVLAKAMVRTLGDALDFQWLEPCVGKGAFLNALALQRVDRNRVTGIDLSSITEAADRHAMVQRSTEFLTWAAATEKRFDRIVANPPFISLSDVPSVVRKAAMRHSLPNGTPVPLGSNCWFAFLCAALRLLNPGGSLAFVLPAAFEFANYAAALRSGLPMVFSAVEVHRCKVPIFDAVEDGSVVLIARGHGSSSRRPLRRVHSDLAELAQGVRQPTLKSPNRTRSGAGSVAGCKTPLHEVMSIGIGAVTGDARYFLMNDQDRLDLGLPTSAMQSVVSKARHIGFPALSRTQWDYLRRSGERLWLFRPRGAALKHKAVQRYLRLQLNKGGCRKDAYKIRTRAPWYLTPLPMRPHGFMSGMSQQGPAICFNEMDGLSVTNTLYTVRFSAHLCREAQYAWALMLLTSEVRKQLKHIARDYALGLAKFEPGDLSQLMIPKPRISEECSSVYAEAFDALMGGDEDRSTWLANQMIKPST